MVSDDLPMHVQERVSKEDCRDQLDRVLSSPEFRATKRQHRFLEYVVDETLSGRGDRIKAYSIALSVFDRNEDFNPQTDPIVRITASDLRRSLERYYLTAGQRDPVVITIPKGSYVPHFKRAPPTEKLPGQPEIPTAQPAAKSRLTLVAAMGIILVLIAGTVWWFQTGNDRPELPTGPSILVQSFEDISGTNESNAIAIGLTQEVIGQLAKFRELEVFVSADESNTQPRFMLQGSISVSDDTFRLRARLLKSEDRHVLWANNYDGNLNVAEFFEMQSDIARSVATTLGQVDGIIFQTDRQEPIANAPDDWVAYACTLSYYAHRERFGAQARYPVKDCLESAVDKFPDYALAWALLAQIYIDEFRFSFMDQTRPSPELMTKALNTARRSVMLDPRNVRGMQAEMLALFLTGQQETALSVGRQAIQTNPNDTELMSEYGYRLALSGNWDEGCALISNARNRNPAPSGYYESGLAVCAYFNEDYAEAENWITKTPVPDNPIYHLIAAAIFAETGDVDAAENARVWLTENAPVLARNLRREVSRRLGNADDVETFLGSLKKAGLEVPEQ